MRAPVNGCPEPEGRDAALGEGARSEGTTEEEKRRDGEAYRASLREKRISLIVKGPERSSPSGYAAVVFAPDFLSGFSIESN